MSGDNLKDMIPPPGVNPEKPLLHGGFKKLAVTVWEVRMMLVRT